MTNPVNPPLVPDLPPAPLVTDTPEQFDEKAFPFAEALNPWGRVLNSSASASRTNAIASKEGASDSQASAAQSAESAQEAKDAVTAAASVSGAVKWVGGNPYAEGQAVWSPLDGQTYRAKAAVSGTVDPSNDPANWAQLGVNLAQLYAATLSI